MKTIKLQLYRGKELSYDKTGKVKNEQQVIKLSDGIEWFNYLKYIKAQGLCQVDFISVIENSKEIKDISVWANQLKEACTPAIEVVVVESISIDATDSNGHTQQLSTTMDKKTLRELLKSKAESLNITYAKTASNEKIQELIDKAEKV